MNQKVESLILEELSAMRADLANIGRDMARLRGEMAELASTVAGGSAQDPVATVRRLWDEGVSSGVAGDLDDILDDVLASLPRSGSAM